MEQKALILPEKMTTVIEIFGVTKPAEIVGKATEIANSLAPIIEKRHLYNAIKGKKFVRAEGWTCMGAMLGVFPFVEWSRKLTDEPIAYESRVVIKTMSGAVISAAEAICSAAEGNWKGRDEYAVKSMSQTRATGKAFRLPFAWILVLAGFEPTPAEEMDSQSLQENNKSQTTPTLKLKKSSPKQDPLKEKKQTVAALFEEFHSLTDKETPEIQKMLADGGVKSPIIKTEADAELQIKILKKLIVEYGGMP